MCHFSLERRADASLWGLPARSVATALELRSPTPSLRSCLLALFHVTPRFCRHRHSQGAEENARIPRDPPMAQGCSALLEIRLHILSGACRESRISLLSQPARCSQETSPARPSSLAASCALVRGTPVRGGPQRRLAAAVFVLL